MGCHCDHAEQGRACPDCCKQKAEWKPCGTSGENVLWYRKQALKISYKMMPEGNRPAQEEKGFKHAFKALKEKL